MTGFPAPWVLDAFKRAGLPAPTPERVTERGYSAAEARAIDRHSARLAEQAAKEAARADV